MPKRTKYPEAYKMGADADRNGWERGVSTILWMRYGVRRIGLDDLMSALKAEGNTPAKAAQAIGKKFDLTPLEGLDDA